MSDTDTACAFPASANPATGWLALIEVAAVAALLGWVLRIALDLVVDETQPLLHGLEPRMGKVGGHIHDGRQGSWLLALPLTLLLVRAQLADRVPRRLLRVVGAWTALAAGAIATANVLRGLPHHRWSDGLGALPNAALWLPILGLATVAGVRLAHGRGDAPPSDRCARSRRRALALAFVGWLVLGLPQLDQAWLVHGPKRYPPFVIEVTRERLHPPPTAERTDAWRQVEIAGRSRWIEAPSIVLTPAEVRLVDLHAGGVWVLLEDDAARRFRALTARSRTARARIVYIIDGAVSFATGVREVDLDGGFNLAGRRQDELEAFARLTSGPSGATSEGE